MNNLYEALLAKVQQEIPGARVIRKSDSRFMRFLAWIVINIFRNKNFLTSFTTTISRTVYVPDNFFDRTDSERYMTLRHELMHLRQFRNWPFKFLGRPYLWVVNLLIMSFCYLLVFPIWVTLRSKFEKEGYEQTLLSRHELGYINDEFQVTWMINTFAGPSYLYMDTRPSIEKWVRKTIEDINAGKIVNEKDRIKIDGTSK